MKVAFQKWRRHYCFIENAGSHCQRTSSKLSHARVFHTLSMMLVVTEEARLSEDFLWRSF